MVDIFDEVEEELRADRAQALLKRYGGLLVAAAIFVIVAVGGWQAWSWYAARQNMAAAREYLAAMNLAESPGPAASAKDRAAAADAFAGLTNKGTDGYRTLSRLQAAALKFDQGDKPMALGLWDQVAADGSADPLLRDLARLLWAQHQVDGGDPAAIEAKLQPLLAPDNPWHAPAEEVQALLDLRQGKTDAAKATLKRLSADASAPAGVRGRASGLLARLGG